MSNLKDFCIQIKLAYLLEKKRLLCLEKDLRALLKQIQDLEQWAHDLRTKGDLSLAKTLNDISFLEHNASFHRLLLKYLLKDITMTKEKINDQRQFFTQIRKHVTF